MHLTGRFAGDRNFGRRSSSYPCSFRNHSFTVRSDPARPGRDGQRARPSSPEGSGAPGPRRVVHATDHSQADGGIRRGRTRRRRVCIPGVGQPLRHTPPGGTAPRATRRSSSRSTTRRPVAPTTSRSSRAYADTTPEGTPVYIYVPAGALDGVEPGRRAQPRPAFDPNPDDEFVPCADARTPRLRAPQAQIDYLGDELADQIVAVDEDALRPDGRGRPERPASDSLVTLVYNVQDDELLRLRRDDLHRRLLRARVHRRRRA